MRYWFIEFPPDLRANDGTPVFPVYCRYCRAPIHEMHVCLGIMEEMVKLVNQRYSAVTR
jgi:hypothetical protein